MADDLILKADTEPFELAEKGGRDPESVHKYRGKVCRTDTRGFATPRNLDMRELRVDSHLGFVPLWGPDVTLRWRFNEASLAAFRNPDAARKAIRQLFIEAIDGWDDAAPVAFSEQRDNVDFEIVMRANADCDSNGCTLAQAFFPDQGKHEVLLFPTFFQQTRQEQVETMQHEFGHVFGLRHFFAAVSETAWPSELFGKDRKFTIMNYGDDSRLTIRDRKDLRALYEGVWSGKLKKINGTEVRLMRPFSELLARGSMPG